MSNTTPFGYPIPTARRVSPLRQRMIEDMKVRNFAANTQDSYLRQVSLFARHFGKSPEQLGPEEIRTYQIYLTDGKKVSVGTRIVAVSALWFFYAVTHLFRVENGKLRYVHTLTHLLQANFQGRGAAPNGSNGGAPNSQQ
jgi:hypothetical protein